MDQNRLQRKRRRRQAKRAEVQRRTRATWRHNQEHPPRMKTTQVIQTKAAAQPGAVLGAVQYDAEAAPVESLTQKVKHMIGL